MSQSEDAGEDTVPFNAQFNWSPELTPKMIADNHKKLFPVIAIVTSGYDGCDGMHEFALDEVYWIVDIKKQKRVVLTDSSHRFISIPFDYHVKFHKIASNGKPNAQVQSLSQIFDGRDGGAGGDGGFGNIRLMFEDNRAVKFNECASSGSTDQMGCLEYTEAYDERYLVCHPLQDNEILADVVLIPVYVPISLTIATGFSSLIKGEFDDWMASIKASIKGFDTTGVKTCMDVVVFDDSPASDYVTIMPVSLFQHTKKDTDVVTTSPSTVENNEYLNITRCKEMEKSRHGKGSKQPRTKNRRSVFIDLPDHSFSTTHGSSTTGGLRPGPALPPRSGSSPGPPPSSPRERRSPMPGQRSLEAMSSRTGTPPPLPPRTDSMVKRSPSAPSKFTSGERSKVAPCPIPEEPRPSTAGLKRLPAPPPLNLTETKPQKVSPTGNATRFVKNIEEPTEPNQNLSGSSSPKSFSKSSRSSPAKDDLKPIPKSRQPDEPHRRLPLEKDPLDKTTTACPGVVKKPVPSKELPSGKTGRSWESASDIPVDLDISSLSVGELCLCLELLKMEKYSQMFREQMVDGTLLLELPDESLCEVFGFNVFEVKKLANFARNGWRPKTN